MCSDQFVAFMGTLEPCMVYFANDLIHLHLRGDIVLGIHKVTTEKDHLLGCPEDGNNETKVDDHETQTLHCKQVQVFSSVIQCVSIYHPWWDIGGTLEDTFLKPVPSTRCDLRCPYNCLCTLSDRQVIYNCPKDNQHLDKNHSSFLLFFTDVSRLDFSRNQINVLMTNTFTNIGKHIRYLDLSSNHLSSLEKGVFNGLNILVFLSLGNNALILPRSWYFFIVYTT